MTTHTQSQSSTADLYAAEVERRYLKHTVCVGLLSTTPHGSCTTELGILTAVTAAYLELRGELIRMEAVAYIRHALDTCAACAREGGRS